MHVCVYIMVGEFFSLSSSSVAFFGTCIVYDKGRGTKRRVYIVFAGL